MRPLAARRCTLEPLVRSHAPVLYAALLDPAIYEFENEPPASLEAFAQRCAWLESRASLDGTEQWLNWVVRLPGGEVAGHVQATVMAGGTSLVAYELASRHWRQGIGTDAVQAMLGELRARYGVRTFVAVYKARNHRSEGLLRKLGFEPAGAAEQQAHRDAADERVMVRAADRGDGPLRVEVLGAHHAPVYRSLMLEAYEQAADAFTSTAEERAAEPLAWWERRIAAPDGLSRCFGAFDGERLVGTVALEYGHKPKTRHAALVIGMYLQPGARGRGGGLQLMQAAFADAMARPGLRQLRLTVTEGNGPALRLYESVGFVAWGTEPMAILTAGGYKGKVHMTRPLTPPETTMFTTDTCCTLVPYFEVQPGQLEAFKALGPQFVARTRNEAGCVHYAFSFDGHNAHCREGYVDAEAVLAHLQNVGELLGEALKIARIVRLEVHGPAAELEKLRGPLASLGPQFFLLEEGIRRTAGA